ncbi:MAG TPA: cupin domain-containing protein [Alphaproteobacteria bacterium]|nr:cupin domain-containing protein [Alphaproteobacteria bacterium]
MPKIDLSKARRVTGSRYPKPFDEPCMARENLRLGDAADLTQFGVNITTLRAGAWSSQRHWHGKEDEFVYVISGELILVEDEGETILKPGDCAAWKAGVPNGHHLINRTAKDASFLVVGSRDPEDWGVYSDIDMQFHRERAPKSPGPNGGFTRKDGTPY